MNCQDIMVYIGCRIDICVQGVLWKDQNKGRSNKHIGVRWPALYALRSG